jgi:protein-tyrosine phosphatase
MVDLHCHALFNIDDGATDFDVMAKMLRIAYDDGIRDICFTPHFKQYLFKNDDDIRLYVQKIDGHFKLATEHAVANYPDLNLYIGNEIMFHHDILDSICSKKCFTISNTSFVLVEFKPSTPFFEMQSALSNLLRKGFSPVLAHVERYADLVKDFSKVRELSEIGVLIQVNASSILKFRFGKSARFIKKLFKHSLVDLIATDAHDAENYSPVMSSAVALISKKYGEQVAKKVSCTIPKMILSNQKKH